MYVLTLATPFSPIKIGRTEEIAKKKGIQASQLVIAWILAQGEDFIPIPGTKKVKYLEENAESVNVKVSKEEDAEIRKAIEAAGGMKGARYPPAVMQGCFGDSPDYEQWKAEKAKH